MSERLERELRAALEAARAAGLARSIEPPRGLDVVTNDYLSLARDPALAAAAADAARAEGAGAPAARLLGGDRPSHRLAEARAAAWLRAEAALLLPTGTQANAAALQALVRPGDAVLSDARNHASLVDAIRGLRARRYVYAHRDVAALARALALAADAPRRVIVTDSIFSMTGGTAPLAEIVALARAHDAEVVLDEAHAVGVIGPEGAGLAVAFGLERDVAARVVTGGKALGVAGGFVVGSRALVDAVLNFGRAFLFTTAVAPPVAAALAVSIDLARHADPRRARLSQLSARLRAALREEGFEIEEHATPIVFVNLGSTARAMEIAAAARAEGFDVRAVRPPTVPDGESGLRLVVHADHREAELLRLTRVLGVARRARPIAPGGGPASALRAVTVVGTDTGVGKTLVSTLLLLAAARAGDATYWKPMQTGEGEDDDTATIATRVRGVARVRVLDPVFRAPEPIAPHQAAARRGVAISESAILERARAIAADNSGTLVIETAGGLAIPLGAGRFQDALVAKLGAPVVLVARTGLGTLHATRAVLEMLASRGIALAGVVLVGDVHAENQRDVESWVSPIPVIRVPRLDRFDAATLARAAEAAGFDRIFDRVGAWRAPGRAL